MEINLKIQFKTKEAYEQFDKVDRRIQGLVLLASYFMQKAVPGYVPTVTSVYRSQSEQDALRQAGAPAVAHSPHTEYRAADLRINDYSGEKYVPYFEQIINTSYPRNDGLKTALVHGEGANRHLHLQVPQVKA